MAEAIRTRREALCAGGLALGGLALDGLFRLREARGESPAKNPGRAKSCILIFQWGGPSQLDTWDPKPDAPAEVRGRVRRDRDERPGRPDQRAFPAARRQDAPPGDRPLDEARRPRPTSRRRTGS